MPYNQETAERVRRAMRRRQGCTEKKMFGGVGFLLNDNMCVGVWREFLILRVDPDDYENLLAEPFARVFDITGRVMKGWIMVEPGGFKKDSDLSLWIQAAIRFVRTLPPK